MSHPPTLFIASPGAGYNCTGAHFAISAAVGKGMRFWERTFGPTAKTAYLCTNRMSVDKARNRLAKAAIEAEADWIFWIDDDMDPPADVIERLYAHQVPLASGLCSKRQMPPEIMAYVFEGPDSHKVIKSDWEGLHDVDAVGMACVLMNREVLQYVYDLNKGEPFHYHGGKYGTEDIGFFEDAHKAGYKVVVDGSVHVDHLGVYAFSPVASKNVTPLQYGLGAMTKREDYAKAIGAFRASRGQS